MKKNHKQRYTHFMRKIGMSILPAILLFLGSCSNEDEVIELTSDDMNIQFYQKVDTDTPLALEKLDMDRISKDGLADGDEVSAKLSLSGVTRLYYTASTNLFGTYGRLWTTNTTSNTLIWPNRTTYMKSIVIPPYTNVRLYASSGGSYPFTNRYSSSAKYIGNLGAPFTNSGVYVTRVETNTYSQQGTEQLCGYAYYHDNFGGAQMPVFRSTPMKETDLENLGRTAFESFQSLSGSNCGGVTFFNTDDTINSSNRSTTGVTIEGANDNTDLGLQTYDAFTPYDKFDNVDVSGFTSTSGNNILDGISAAATDNISGTSSAETVRCTNGADTCFAVFSVLSQVSDFGAKLNCKGVFGVWNLMVKYAQIIANKQWYKLGLLMGDALQVYAAIGTPVGEAMAGYCVLFAGLRTAFGLINSTWCTSLKNKCEAAAQNGTGGRDDYLNDF